MKNGILHSPTVISINRRKFAAGLALLGLTGGMKEKAAAMSAITNQNSDMSLSVATREDNKTLHLTYQVTNTSGRTLYLFDVLHGEFDGSVFPLVDACYATIEQDQLVLSRQIVQVPGNMLVDVENIPFVTAIQSGSSIEKTVKQPLPVYPWTPYTDHDTIPEPKGVLQLNTWFRLGYFLAAPGTAELLEAVQTDQGTRPAFNPFPYASQKLIMAGPLGTVETYDMG